MATSGKEDWGGFSSVNELATVKSSSRSTAVEMVRLGNTSPTSTSEDVSEMSHQHPKELTMGPDVAKTEGLIGLEGGIGKVVATQFIESSRQQGRKMFDVYGNIDILRPYFDIEPKVLLNRIIHSFVPTVSVTTPQKIPGDLYGPLMTVFTLVAILLTFQPGAILGNALGVCFGYWIGASGFMYFLSYICRTYINIVQCFSLVGYGMISHCIIVLFSNTAHGIVIFYMWLLLAGLAASRMTAILLSRTVGISQRLLLGVTVVSLHILFLPAYTLRWK